MNKFVASEAEITFAESATMSYETESFNPNDCSGSKIQYDINVEAHLSSGSNAQGRARLVYYES